MIMKYKTWQIKNNIITVENFNSMISSKEIKEIGYFILN